MLVEVAGMFTDDGMKLIVRVTELTLDDPRRHALLHRRTICTQKARHVSANDNMQSGSDAGIVPESRRSGS